MLAESGVAQASHHQKLLLVDNLGPRMLVVGCMARTRGVPRPPGQAATAAIPVGATGEFTDATGRVPSDDASMATRTDAISSHDPHGGVLDASVLPERPTPLLADRATVIHGLAARRIGPAVRSNPKCPEPVELAESRAETLATGTGRTAPSLDPHRGR